VPGGPCSDAAIGANKRFGQLQLAEHFYFMRIPFLNICRGINHVQSISHEIPCFMILISQTLGILVYVTKPWVF
jgi:hypothetical protein